MKVFIAMAAYALGAAAAFGFDSEATEATGSDMVTTDIMRGLNT